MVSSVNLTFRVAEDRDLAAILDLIAQPDMDNGKSLTLEAARDILAAMRRYPYYRIHLAETTDGIVGAYALLIMDNLAHMGAPSAIVEQVLVSPDVQGRGVGRKMMQHAMRIAAEHGCYKLALSSNLARARAHAFYDGLGFERHGFSFKVTPSTEFDHA